MAVGRVAGQPGATPGVAADGGSQDPGRWLEVASLTRPAQPLPFTLAVIPRGQAALPVVASG